MVGYRKMAVWAAVFALCVYATFKAFANGAVDIPPTVSNIVIWVTGTFLGANVLDKLTDKNTIGTLPGCVESQPKP